jgi:GT2 family glycosyltransferase
MSEIVLSVAIATCGRPEALRTCLRAITGQSRPPDQVIIVDQDPLPETAQIIASSGLRVDYRQQERLGLSASRNLALSMAVGNVLAVTDDDCFPDPGWSAALERGFASSPHPTGVTGPILPPPGDPPPEMCAISMRLSRETRLFEARTVPWMVGSGANFAARVDALRCAGGWAESLGVGTRGMAGEDCELIDRLLAAGGSILFNGEAAMHHAWQTRERRRETRWSYGYGIGALCGLRLAERDAYALRMLASYSRMHLQGIARELKRRDWNRVVERLTALGALAPGCAYGLRAKRRTDLRARPAVQA